MRAMGLVLYPGVYKTGAARLFDRFDSVRCGLYKNLRYLSTGKRYEVEPFLLFTLS